MSEELISALREGVDGDPNIGLAPANDAMREAADTIEAQAATIEKLRALIDVLLDNDPSDQISDAGHSVLDLWRHEATQALKETSDD